MCPEFGGKASWGALNRRISTEEDPCNNPLAYGLLFDYHLARARDAEVRL